MVHKLWFDLFYRSHQNNCKLPILFIASKKEINYLILILPFQERKKQAIQIQIKWADFNYFTYSTALNTFVDQCVHYNKHIDQ